MKKIIIYCFSGTGNTMRAANAFAKGVSECGAECVVHPIRTDTPFLPPDGYDFVGFAYPVHGFNAPTPVLRYAETMPCANLPFFVIKTSGEGLKLNDASSRRLVRILRDKGYGFQAEFHYLMPYNIIFRHTERMAYEMDRTMQSLAALDAEALLNGTCKPPVDSVAARGVAKVVSIEHLAMPIIGKSFRVDPSRCIGCGKCQKICPCGNIRMEGGMPRFGGACVGCMGCAFGCPRDAVSIGVLNGWKVNGAYRFQAMPEYDGTELQLPRYCNRSYRRYFDHAARRIKKECQTDAERV